jgi:uncharacterized protein YcfL
MKLTIAVMLVLTLIVSGCASHQDQDQDTVEESVNSQEKSITIQEELPPPIPTGTIEIDEHQYEIVSGHFRWIRKVGSETEVTETDAPSPNQIAAEMEIIQSQPGKTATIQIDHQEEPRYSVYLWNEDDREEEISMEDNQFTLPAEEGVYVYEIIARWSNGEVSYTSVVEVR